MKGWAPIDHKIKYRKIYKIERVKRLVKALLEIERGKQLVKSFFP
jgi:hypothetical protein